MNIQGHDSTVALSLRHPTSLPAPCRPIVKWAGGKARLLPQLLPLMPVGVGRMRLVEPFAGGAAVFFGAAPAQALLCDSNPDLIGLYNVVRGALPSMLVHLQELAAAHSREHYYAVRIRYNLREHCSAAERAAMFLYLNKTCFNGLHRVNGRGEFNVPVGRYKKPRILDVEQLWAASQALRRANLRCGDFATTLRLARPGDFVYLDPPYVPSSSTANFTAYAKGGFGAAEQVRLARVVGDLDRRGCLVMLSNSDTQSVRDLYAGYRLDRVVSHRSINRDASGRGAVVEVIVRNY